MYTLYSFNHYIISCWSEQTLARGHIHRMAACSMHNTLYIYYKFTWTRTQANAKSVFSGRALRLQVMIISIYLFFLSFSFLLIIAPSAQENAAATLGARSVHTLAGNVGRCSAREPVAVQPWVYDEDHCDAGVTCRVSFVRHDEGVLESQRQRLEAGEALNLKRKRFRLRSIRVSTTP